MRIKLRPRKGWRFRVIIANEDGDYEYDDVNSEWVIPGMAERLIKRLEVREKNKLFNENHELPKK